MMDALERRARRRRRPAPRLLPQSDRRRPRRRPMGARSRGVVAERGLLPFVDIAYQGLGRGLDEDAARAARAARGVRRSDRRAKLRQEFRRLSRPRRLAVRSRPVERDDDRDGDGPCAADCARNVVDAARSWRRGGAHRPRGCRAYAPTGRPSSTTMRDAHQRGARAASPPPTRAWPISASQYGMFSMLPLTPRAGARAARGPRRSTWPTAAASTSSAWPTTRSTDFVAAVVEAMDG